MDKTYNIKCGMPLILDHEYAHCANTVEFQGFGKVQEISSVYLLLGRPVQLKIPLTEDFKLLVTAPITKKAGRVKAQMMECKLADNTEDEYEYVRYSDIFEVVITPSLAAESQIEVTDPRLELVYAQMHEAYLQILSYESSAQTSAESASASATTATTKAGEASASATSAAESATAAASSASTASGAATTATTKASEASASATSAASSTSTATTKATEAAASATAAATSATAAQVAVSEVTDIRVGADGTTYSTAGEAVRGQISAVDSALIDKADVILNTASGDIASFSDGSANPVVDLKANIVAVQDLHGQSNPYPAGGGKNKFQTTATTQTVNGTTFTVNNDGSVTVSGTPTAVINGGYVLGEVTLPAGTYKVNGCGNPTNVLRLSVYNVTTSSVIASIYNNDDYAFTLTEESVIRLYPFVYTTYSGTQTIKPMIRLSSVTDSTFAPYSNICPVSGFSEVDVVVSPTLDAGDGTTYPISLGSTYYGGVLDVTSGVLTVTHGYIASYDGETLPDTWISDRDVYAEGTTPTTGAEVVYELATPIEINLTPTQVSTLLGLNNIWANSGEVEVLYRADTKKYIDGTIADVPLAMIAPIESGTTSSKAYAIGEYFILNGNQFCKAKTAIASGATFTLNTNYTITTIGAELKALQ